MILSTLLSPDDPSPVVEIDPPDARADILVLCDHASAAIPHRLARLGLGDQALGRHIAYDIGALAVALELGRRWRAPAIASGFSRLVIDCNRAWDDPTSIPPVSDGVTVPGNQALDAAARTARQREIFTPYHDAIARRVERAMAMPGVLALVSIHSFTPTMDGMARPWHIGVLWNEDERLAAPLIAALARQPGVITGDNEPYSGRDGHGYTLPVHAEQRGLPHILIEIRQDLLADPAGIRHWSEILDRALGSILST